jgi:serine/threonine protein kinase
VGAYYIDVALDKAGAQSQVYKVRREGNIYILKLYYPGFEPEAAVVKMLAQAEHPNIAKLHGSGYFDERYYEVYTWYGQGSLAEGRQNQIFVEKTVLPAVDAALNYIHAHGLVHGDIKPANLFLTNDRHSVVVGDYGVASVAGKDSPVRFRGTPEFAPCHTATNGYVSLTPAFDYGSLGLTLVWLLTGQSLLESLFAAGNPPNEQQLARFWHSNLQLPPGIPARLLPLIKGLLEPEQAKRLGHRDIEAHLKSSNERKSQSWCDGYRRVQPRLSPRDLHLGSVGGQPVIVSDLRQLYEAISEHWQLLTRQVNSNKLRVFLQSLYCGDAMLLAIKPESSAEKPERQLFRLYLAIGAELFGETALAQEGLRNVPLCFRGIKASSLPALLGQLRKGGVDCCDLLQLGLFVCYLRFLGVADEVISPCEQLIESLEANASQACAAIVAVFDADANVIYAGDVRLDGLEALKNWVCQTTLEDVQALASSMEFIVWLERLGMRDLARSIKEA